MNQKERDTLAIKIADCAFFYGKFDLDKQSISRFIDIIIKFYNFEPDKILSAFDLYMNDTKNKFFPNPSQLREYLEHKIDSRLSANDLARQLDSLILDKGMTWDEGYYIDGISKYYKGKDNIRYHSFDEAVISFVGQVGLNIISNRGGWKTFCRTGQEASNESVFIAQLRDTCEYALKKESFQNIETKRLTTNGLTKIGIE